MTGSPLMVSIEDVAVNPQQARKHFDYTALADLKESICQNGLLHPLVVKRVGQGYQLVAGERRLRACKMAGIKTVPVVVREATSEDSALLCLVENLQRADLNPMEEAVAYQHLSQEFGLTLEAIAKRVGKSRPTVNNTLRLLDLPQKLQSDVREGRLSAGHAKALLVLKGNPEQMLTLAQDIKNQGLSVRQTEQLVSQHLDVTPADNRQAPLPAGFEISLKRLIHRHFGTTADLIKTPTGWKIDLPQEPPHET